MTLHEHSRHVLITGMPHFVARLLARRILSTEPDARITLLVRADMIDRARTVVGPSSRVRILPSRIVRADLGIAPADRRQLVTDVTDIYHFASLYHLGVDKRHAEDVNIQSTRNLLELARAASSLRRFNHYSTAFVAGDRTGIVLEDELDRGQHFRNTFERTKFTAELEVRRAGTDLPISIFRPSLVVGSAATGEMGVLDGPYFLLQLLTTSPGRIPLNIPSVTGSPFNVVPADFVAAAMHSLSRRDAAEGRTFHLVDPSPIRAEDALQLIAEYANRGSAPSPVHGWMRKRMLSVPAVERYARSGKAYMHELDGSTFFNCTNTLRGLRDTRILCPSFPDYVERLVRWIRSNARSGFVGPPGQAV